MRIDEPSRTARGVALARSQFERPTLPAGDPTVEDLLVADLRTDEEVRRERSYLAARTRFFDDQVIDAATGACRQVVIVGAGYDCRAQRFRSAGVRYFELDHPATQGDKLRRLHALGIPTADVAYGALDLGAADVGAALGALGHRPEVPSLFVCEGLVLYLDREVTAELFAGLAAVATAASRLVASIPIASAAGGRPGFDRRVAAIGEEVRSRYEADEVAPLFTASGWEPREVVDPTGAAAGTGSGRARFVRADRGAAA